MAFDSIGVFGGGVQESLENLILRKMAQQKQDAMIRDMDDGRAIQRRGQDVTMRGQDVDREQSSARLGFDRDKFTEDTRQFNALEPQRTAQTGYLRAQTGEVLRKPQAEQADRDFTTTRDKTQHGYRLGEIAKQGDQSARVAGIRSETAGLMPVRIATVDEQGNPVTRFVSRQDALGGGEFAAAPTAEQRNKSAASARSAPVLSAISELSERINTGQGAIAKISGTVERAKAQANLSDDVAEYDAVVSGFTPMLARAVGHTGVLTEQDVQSVRKMLPQPGDSKSVRDRKITRINSLMGAVSGPAGPSQAGGDDTKTRAADLLKKYGGG